MKILLHIFCLSFIMLQLFTDFVVKIAIVLDYWFCSPKFRFVQTDFMNLGV